MFSWVIGLTSEFLLLENICIWRFVDCLWKVSIILQCWMVTIILDLSMTFWKLSSKLKKWHLHLEHLVISCKSFNRLLSLQHKGLLKREKAVSRFLINSQFIHLIERFYYNASVNSHSQLPAYSKETHTQRPVVTVPYIGR